MYPIAISNDPRCNLASYLQPQHLDRNPTVEGDDKQQRSSLGVIDGLVSITQRAWFSDSDWPSHREWAELSS